MWVIPYSGNLSREKTFANWRKRGFRGENFRTGHTARYMHVWVWSQLIATPTVVRGGGVHWQGHERTKLRSGDRRSRLPRLRGGVKCSYFPRLDVGEVSFLSSEPLGFDYSNICFTSLLAASADAGRRHNDHQALVAWSLSRGGARWHFGPRRCTTRRTCYLPRPPNIKWTLNGIRPKNFADKTFADVQKPRNSRKFSPSKDSRYTVYSCVTMLIYTLLPCTTHSHHVLVMWPMVHNSCDNICSILIGVQFLWPCHMQFIVSLSRNSHFCCV